MPKNIIICCDGTSKDFGQNNSNVVFLFKALEKNTDRQLVYYDPGVGTPSTYTAFNPLTKKLMTVLGLAFGYGLTNNIMSAYHFLMQNYEDGDKIFFFGFSRGAYTVRALAGLIHVCGLLHANGENLIPEAMRLYKDRKLREVANDFKKTFGRACPIHFLGLWDTVSSVGWIYDPVKLQATANNRSVKNVRHAISIDERRAFFRQNLWGSKNADQQDVKQVWFVGEHSDVGGGFSPEKSGLSNIALEWMMVEAIDKGIYFETQELEVVREKLATFAKPHLEKINRTLVGGWHVAEFWMKIVKVRKLLPDGTHKWVSKPYFNRYKFRFIPNNIKHTLHESVLMRLQEDKNYRPKNIMSLTKDLDAIETKFDIEKWVKL